jgi:hypothetical protein
MLTFVCKKIAKILFPHSAAMNGAEFMELGKGRGWVYISDDISRSWHDMP